MVMAVSGFRMRTGLSGATDWPSLFRISLGLTSSPPLATAEPACASWRVVTLISWPNATEAKDVVPHFSSLRKRPGDSAGSCIPVR